MKTKTLLERVQKRMEEPKRRERENRERTRILGYQ
jgi:hypothetical protein